MYYGKIELNVKEYQSIAWLIFISRWRVYLQRALDFRRRPPFGRWYQWRPCPAVGCGGGQTAAGYDWTWFAGVQSCLEPGMLYSTITVCFYSIFFFANEGYSTQKCSKNVFNFASFFIQCAVHPETMLVMAASFIQSYL